MLLAFCLVFLACGGGGGGGGGGESVSVSLSPGSSTVGLNGQVLFVATVSNSTNPAVTWSSTSGTITPTGDRTATFTAPNFETQATVTAASVADPTKTDSSVVTVQQGVATVTGQVLRQSSSLGLSGVVVEFRDNTGTVLATATTNSFGNFSAAVPVAAVRFHLQNATVPVGYYKQFNYDGMRFATTITTCSAPLPALTEGVTTPLATTITVPATTGPPPPPPNGCT